MLRFTVYELGSYILQSEAEHYGIDWHGPVSHEPQEQAVSVPVTQSPLSGTDHVLRSYWRLFHPLKSVRNMELICMREL